MILKIARPKTKATIMVRRGLLKRRMAHQRPPWRSHRKPTWRGTLRICKRTLINPPRKKILAIKAIRVKVNVRTKTLVIKVKVRVKVNVRKKTLVVPDFLDSA